MLIQYIIVIYEFCKRYISAGLLVSLGQLVMFFGIARLADYSNDADKVLKLCIL